MGQQTGTHRRAEPPPVGPLSALDEAVLELVGDRVIVFDVRGRVVYAGEAARRVALAERDTTPSAEKLRPRLIALGASVTPLFSGGAPVGERVLLPNHEPPRTLAEHEREAILDALQQTHGRPAEAARRLGISRTTLWRRLRAYGVPRQGEEGRLRILSSTALERD